MIRRRASVYGRAGSVIVAGHSAFGRLRTGLIAIGGVLGFGVLGYVWLGWGWFDAFYMVVITISGVGFGEVRPRMTEAERTHTILVIAFGLVSVAYTVAGLVAMLTEGEILKALGHQRMRRLIAEQSGHAVIAGFGRIGSMVADELSANGSPLVVIERAGERVPEIERRGYLFVRGDATDESILVAAGIERARVLVSVMPNDADNVFITLTARQIAPRLEIIARAEQPSTQKTLRQAGAGHVVMPAAIGAHRIASLLTNPSAVEFAELVTHHTRLALELEEVPIGPGSSLVGQTLIEADIRRKTDALVVAIKHADGRMEFPPGNESRLAPGDVVVLLGARSNLDRFREHFPG